MSLGHSYLVFLGESKRANFPSMDHFGIFATFFSALWYLVLQFHRKNTI